MDSDWGDGVPGGSSHRFPEWMETFPPTAGNHKWQRVSIDHAANIRDGGKTVHVVFKYLSRSCCRKDWDGWSNAFSLTIPYFIS